MKAIKLYTGKKKKLKLTHAQPRLLTPRDNLLQNYFPNCLHSLATIFNLIPCEAIVIYNESFMGPNCFISCVHLASRRFFQSKRRTNESEVNKTFCFFSENSSLTVKTLTFWRRNLSISATKSLKQDTWIHSESYEKWKSFFFKGFMFEF